MRQILRTSNGAIVVRMPRPTVERGSVLVRVHYSFISAGTELAPLRATVSSDASPIEKAQAYLSLSRTYIGAALRNPAGAVRFAARFTRETLGRSNSRRAEREVAGSAGMVRDETADQGWSLGYSV